MTQDEYLTVSQAARESHQSQKSIRRHIAKGALKVERWGPFRRIRIRRSEFDAYLRPLSSDMTSVDMDSHPAT